MNINAGVENVINYMEDPIRVQPQDLSNLQLSLVNINAGVENIIDYMEDSSRVRPQDLSIALNEFINVMNNQAFWIDINNL